VRPRDLTMADYKVLGDFGYRRVEFLPRRHVRNSEVNSWASARLSRMYSVTAVSPVTAVSVDIEGVFSRNVACCGV
jgi:hypothetical protein